MKYHVFTIAPIKLTLYLKVKDFIFLWTFKLEVVILKIVANLLLKSKVEAVGAFWSIRRASKKFHEIVFLPFYCGFKCIGIQTKENDFQVYFTECETNGLACILTPLQ